MYGRNKTETEVIDMTNGKKPSAVAEPKANSEETGAMAQTDRPCERYEPIKDPFGKNIGSADLFRHRQLEELQALVRSCVSQQVMGLITGPPGSGKTTCVRSVTDELPSHKYTVVYLGQDQIGTNLLTRFAASLGLQAKRYRAHLTMQISRWLIDNLESGGKEVALIVDEAHLLDDGMLEEFRLMTNASYDRLSPLTLILLGQAPLRLRLRSAKFEALSQRLRYRFRLEGLNQDETTRYIQLRLLAAGMAPEVFSQDAFHQIFQLCEGLPRRVNNLCSLALLRAKVMKRSTIDAAFINELADLD